MIRWGRSTSVGEYHDLGSDSARFPTRPHGGRERSVYGTSCEGGYERSLRQTLRVGVGRTYRQA